MVEPEMPTEGYPLIERVRIERLFGLYSYDLSLADLSVEAARLMILYGDNGSGKTTILRLLYHALSPEGNRGHRTFLAQTPFARLSIVLSDGAVVEAARSSDVLVGPYQMTISRNSEAIYSTLVEIDSDGRVRKGLEALSPALGTLGVSLQYMADDRRPLGLSMQEALERSQERGAVTGRVRSRYEEDALGESIRQLERWIRQQALRGSQRGEQDATSIYADVARRIAGMWSDPKPDAQITPSELPSALAGVEARASAFAKYGLMSPISVGDMVRALETSADKELLARVLSPYVRGIQARLDALQVLQSVLEIFHRNINGFLADKSISLDVGRGLVITLRTGAELKPRQLSSGERQLLLLLCGTIPAAGAARIVLIDEPELSLNIKWQRRLVDALLECTQGRAVQFIIATHSFEILAPRRASVVTLKDSGAEGPG